MVEQIGAGLAADQDRGLGALVFDATGITDLAGLSELYAFFHPRARSLMTSGRVIVLGTPPADCGSPEEATAQRALEGFTRSVGKEFGRGTTAQLVYVRPGAENGLASTCGSCSPAGRRTCPDR